MGTAWLSTQYVLALRAWEHARCVINVIAEIWQPLHHWAHPKGVHSQNKIGLNSTVVYYYFYSFKETVQPGKVANSSQGQRGSTHIRTWFPDQVARQAFSPTVCKSRSVSVTSCPASVEGTPGKGAPSSWSQSLFSWLQFKQFAYCCVVFFWNTIETIFFFKKIWK